MKYLSIILAPLLAACGSPDAGTNSGGGAKHSSVIEAENLLAEKSPAAFAIYDEFIWRVQVGQANGVDLGSGVLTLQPEFIRRASVPFLASSLAHDAYHVKHQIGCTAAEEEAVIQWQIGVLRQVGGAESDHLSGLIGFHDCANNTVHQ